MKKATSLLVALVVSTILFSQKLTTPKVPATVKESFQKAHPGATASWEWEDAAYEANFREGGKAMSCVITRAGTIVETEYTIALGNLPAAARKYVQQHYKDKKIKDVAKIVKAGGEINYEVNVQGQGDILFDNEGNRIEKREKSEKD